MRENAVDGESGSAANEARIRIKMYPGERVKQTSELRETSLYKEYPQNKMQSGTIVKYFT